MLHLLQLSLYNVMPQRRQMLLMSYGCLIYRDQRWRQKILCANMHALPVIIINFNMQLTFDSLDHVTNSDRFLLPLAYLWSGCVIATIMTAHTSSALGKNAACIENEAWGVSRLFIYASFPRYHCQYWNLQARA